jgi:hypothetical protein
MDTHVSNFHASVSFVCGMPMHINAANGFETIFIILFGML